MESGSPLRQVVPFFEKGGQLDEIAQLYELEALDHPCRLLTVATGGEWRVVSVRDRWIENGVLHARQADLEGRPRERELAELEWTTLYVTSDERAIANYEMLRSQVRTAGHWSNPEIDEIWSYASTKWQLAWEPGAVSSVHPSLKLYRLERLLSSIQRFYIPEDRHDVEAIPDMRRLAAHVYYDPSPAVQFDVALQIFDLVQSIDYWEDRVESLEAPPNSNPDAERGTLEPVES